MSDTVDVFDPVLFSLKENVFLLENLGKPTVVAMQDIPAGVNPRAVRPVLARVEELEQLRSHSGQGWVGVDAIKEKISAYLRENAKWRSDAVRYRGPRSEQIKRRYPSLYAWDSRGRGQRGGIGSDQGRVRSYFDAKGGRVPFAVALFEDLNDNWIPPGAEQEITVTGGIGIKRNDDMNRIECFCGHTESFKEESEASYRAARARISKHLRKATTQVDEHREVHAAEFS